jgi:N-acylneuraminate cytidylyltransferase
MRTVLLDEYKKMYGSQEILTDNTGSVEISELEGQDIDNEVDWKSRTKI